MGLLSKFRPKKGANIREEVVEHLTDFLNTKRNFGAYPKDYGIDSYIYLGTDHQVMMQLISDVRTGLEKYEKRVQDVVIEPTPQPNSFVLAFRISCKIEEISYQFQLSFQNQKNLFHLEAAK